MPRQENRRRVLLSLLWITAVHTAALYLFTTGFFLTRFEVADVSECHVPPFSTSTTPSHLRSIDDDDEERGRSTSSSGCWMPRRFRRVVFVVIDALRFDFVLSGGSASSKSSSAMPSFYLNHLPILNATLHTQPAHTLLLKFVADAPTMTMQRLKGLTTGGLPTFLDIKDNMASSEITEDNLIRQMHVARRPIVFMGDDTWDALYPTQFTRKYSYDSFNVKDLHTVDRGVVDHLFPELLNRDWDLLIAHLLGVDHVGHTHGPNSPYMTEKLDEMNGVLTKLLQALPDDDDTLLLIMGDHGMSEDGNHGGASDDETGAALFVYSKKPIVDPLADLKWSQDVPQVDLVPTLALLAGLPIPFGSLGAIIPQLFESDHTLFEALRLNVAQVRRYLITYSSASKLPQSDFDHLERLYDDIATREASDDLVSNASRQAELVEKQQAYLREALALGRSIWTQFDLCSMAWGIGLLLIGQVLVLWQITSHDAALADGDTAKLIVVGMIAGAVLGGAAPSAMAVLPKSVLGRILALAVLGSVASPLLQSVSAFSSKHFSQWVTRLRHPDSAAVVAFITVLLHALALLSNSYIIAEDKVMNFLVASVGVYLLWVAWCGTSSRDRTRTATAAVVFLVASRVVSAVEPPNIIQSATSIVRTWLPLAALLVICVGTVGGALHHQVQPSVLALHLGKTSAAAAASSLYWYWSPIASPFWRLWLPRSVFLLLLSAIGHRVWRVAMPPPSSSCKTHRAAENASFAALVVLAYSLVLGPTSPLTTLGITIQHASFAFIAHQCRPSGSAISSSWVLLWCAVCYQSFFTTGHQNTFTGLQNACAFVGFDGFQFYWAGALLGFNTFGNYAMAVLAMLPFLASTDSSSQWWSLRVVLFTLIAYFALNALVSTAFVALQRRHLMVWAIFAPKFIFDGATLIIVELFAIVATAVTIAK